MSSFVTPVDFGLRDQTDQTKFASFDLSLLQTGTSSIIQLPDYGGGIIPLPVNEGSTNDVLVSQGAGFAPGWVGGYVNTSGALTANRIPIVSAGATIADDSDLTFSGGDTLNCTKLVITTSLTTVGGTAPVADGTYTVGARLTPGGTDGTITTKSGIITAITQAT